MDCIEHFDRYGFHRGTCHLFTDVQPAPRLRTDYGQQIMPKTATILRYIKIAQDDRSGRPASEMTALHAVTANTEPGFRKTNENPDQSQDDSSPVTKTGTESPQLLTAPRHRAPAATMPPQSRKSEHSSLTAIQDSNRNPTETQQKTPADQPQKCQK